MEFYNRLEHVYELIDIYNLYRMSSLSNEKNDYIDLLESAYNLTWKNESNEFKNNFPNNTLITIRLIEDCIHNNTLD